MSLTWEAALKQDLKHFPFKCQRQHMFWIGAELAWSMGQIQKTLFSKSTGTSMARSRRAECGTNIWLENW